jgi:FSR family fosmidomycin resistance protein-like MFS transporter
MADRMDLRRFIILAPAVTAIAMSLVGIAPSYMTVAALLLIVGFSSAAFHVPGPVMVARVSGSQVGKGMSFWMTAGELARAIGPLAAVGVAALLTQNDPWPLVAVCGTSLVGILASTVIYVRIKDVPLQVSNPSPSSLGEAWRALQHFMLPLFAIIIARGFMSGTVMSFLPTLLKAEGQSLWFGGIALAVLEFSGAVGALLAGTFSDRLGRRRMLLLSMSAAPPLMLLFLASEGWLMLPALVLMGLAVFSTAPVILALVQDHAREHPATANGLYMGISFVINSAVPIAVGALGDTVGLRTAFTWSALLALGGVPFIYFLPRDEHWSE